MRLFVLLALAVCLGLSGCAEEQQHVQDTGRSVNLWPTSREQRAGDQ